MWGDKGLVHRGDPNMPLAFSPKFAKIETKK